MDDVPVISPSAPAGPRWRDWHCLALLFALVVPLRAWLLYNTEVMARDSVGYIRYALRFDDTPWHEVLCSFDQHPGYAWTIWLVSLPARAWTGTLTPELMQFCAQFVSAVAAVILVVPMYLIGKALWEVRVGLGAALLFQFLPMSGHHLSDGISESLFLCLLAWALLFGVWGMQTQAARWFIACGLFTGLAYLTRPEGAVVLAAMVLTLIGCQVKNAWREPWGRWLRNVACLAGSALLVGSLYVSATGVLTVKPSIKKMVETATNDDPAPARQPGLRAQLWADSFTTVTSRHERLWFSVRALVTEIGSALHYLGIVPLACALWWHGRGLLGNPARCVPAVYAGLHASALLRLGASAGYVSDRHLMPLVLMLTYLVMLGILELGRRWQQWRGGARPRWQVSRHALAGAALVMLAAYIALSLPQTLKRLHGNRAGNRAAGYFLAERLRPGDLVLDDHVWSHYYAGQVFLERKQVPAAPDYQPMCYLVMTRSNQPIVAKDRKKIERELRAAKSEIIFFWPKSGSVEKARIVIHALPRDPTRHPWVTASR